MFVLNSGVIVVLSMMSVSGRRMSLRIVLVLGVFFFLLSLLVIVDFFVLKLLYIFLVVVSIVNLWVLIYFVMRYDSILSGMEIVSVKIVI